MASEDATGKVVSLELASVAGTGKMKASASVSMAMMGGVASSGRSFVDIK